MKYFAYGSNMLLQRLHGRVPGAKSLGRACLADHRLAWHKVNADGSGKCDIVEDEGSLVWGVIYDIDPGEKHDLDLAEGLGRGYSEKHVTVDFDGESIRACTYFAIRTDPSVKPYGWYRDLVLIGAVQHRLPDAYTDGIRAVEVIPDPDTGRRERNRRLLPDQHRH